MRKIGFILMFCLTSLAVFAQKHSPNYRDTIYQFTFGGIQNDVCNQIKATPDGGFVMIGTTNSFGAGATDFYAIKVDSNFKYQWSSTYGGGMSDEGFSVTPTLDKGYAFVGFTDSYGAGGYDVLLVKTDSTGKEQWQQTYGGTDWDFGYSVQQTKDSGYVICGLTYSGPAINGDVFIVKTDKKGDTLWTRTVGDSGYDVGKSVYVDQDSVYYVTGSTTSFGCADTNIYFIKINNNGLIEKDTTYGGIKHTVIGNSIEKQNLGGFIISGYSNISGNAGRMNPFFIMMDDSANIQTWDTNVDYHSGFNICNDAVQCPDFLYIAACTGDENALGGLDALDMLMYYSPGSIYNGFYDQGPYEGGPETDVANSCAISNNGGVAFAGTTNSSTLTAGLNDVFVCYYKNCGDIWQDDSMYHVLKQFKDSLPVTVGVNTVQANQVMVKVFPNPSSTNATILVQADLANKYWFSLYDITGKCIIDRQQLMPSGYGQAMLHLNCTALQAGAYIYKVIDKNNQAVNGKLIIE